VKLSKALEYDDVANDQRRVIYQQRNELMEADDLAEAIAGIREEVIGMVVDEYVQPDMPMEDWDLTGLEQALRQDFDAAFVFSGLLAADKTMDEVALKRHVVDEIESSYSRKVEQIGPEIMRQFEKIVMLGQLDKQWKEHLAAMDYLRQGIHLRGYAQKNPKQEYKREAFQMFSQMLDQMKHDVISIVSRAQLRSEQDVEAMEEQRSATTKMQFRHAEAQSAIASAPAPAGASLPPMAAGPPGGAPGGPPQQAAEPVQPFVRSEAKVGRNEPCPCGSGKKYKRCHGKLS